MNYTDGFVAAVPKANKEKYMEYAKKSAMLFKEHGAISVCENWEDDVPDGKMTSFPMAVKREANECVVFSWITWPSKEARDKAWSKLTTDPRMKPETGMPFDGKRMIYGGFQNLVQH